MKCIVVDDEPLARQAIKSLIEQLPELQFMAEFSHAEPAAVYLHQNLTDLVFLDIQMPGLNGLNFARTISKETLVIFTTAYNQYALESYEIDAIDYLLKPIKQSRFEKAVQKAMSYKKLLTKNAASVNEISKDFCFIKSEKRTIKVLFSDVLFVEGLKDYVILHTTEQKIITAMNIKTIQSQLPQATFIRVAKSYLINKLKIGYFDNNTVYIDQHEIPIGNAYRSSFFDFVNRNLLSR
ncbi:LytR/AlgR family response regulator transcription factor [Pedobacter ureilyticus]|uniref:LytR/AlgR family response regulator transcription factor n=1 Tax=Pedobacter ureilyticus TaxID=1393051 RepID=A0ABW9J2P5_9SPHI|nr:LytTR family DNA-binding domain-containing protein [Pedobacter helvus]